MSLLLNHLVFKTSVRTHLVKIRARNLSSVENEPLKKLHTPVLLNEVLQYLVHDKKCEDFKTYIDMTFGAGGHTSAILDKNPNSVVYALDRDPNSVCLAQELALKYPGRLIPLHGKFSDLDKCLSENKVGEKSVDAALIDCGASSIQFDTPGRGFSVSRDGPLDMRMDCNSDQITAGDIVNKLDEESLGKILWKYGEERLYKKIAHGIVYFRNDHGPIQTTQQLANIVASIVKQNRTDSMSRPTHVATKTFQALRILVNNELNELSNGISIVYKYLKPQARLAVISFHSLEDRIVKNHFNDASISGDDLITSRGKEKTRLNKFRLNRNVDLDSFSNLVRNLWTPVNKKVLLPSDEEIIENPRSRSAKLRVAVKN